MGRAWATGELNPSQKEAAPPLQAACAALHCAAHPRPPHPRSGPTLPTTILRVNSRDSHAKGSSTVDPSLRPCTMRIWGSRGVITRMVTKHAITWPRAPLARPKAPPHRSTQSHCDPQPQAMPCCRTSLGAIRDASVNLFSAGGVGPLAAPVMTSVSPLRTSFTVPLNHPAFAAMDPNCAGSARNPCARSCNVTPRLGDENQPAAPCCQRTEAPVWN